MMAPDMAVLFLTLLACATSDDPLKVASELIDFPLGIDSGAVEISREESVWGDGVRFPVDTSEEQVFPLAFSPDSDFELETPGAFTVRHWKDEADDGKPIDIIFPEGVTFSYAQSEEPSDIYPLGAYSFGSGKFWATFKKGSCEADFEAQFLRTVPEMSDGGYCGDPKWNDLYALEDEYYIVADNRLYLKIFIEDPDEFLDGLGCWGLSTLVSTYEDPQLCIKYLVDATAVRDWVYAQEGIEIAGAPPED